MPRASRLWTTRATLAMSSGLSASAWTMLAAITVSYTLIPWDRAPSAISGVPNRFPAVSTMKRSRPSGAVVERTG